MLVDDIISSGETMYETVLHLKALQFSSMVCVGVHVVFADNAYEHLEPTPL